MCAVGLNEGDVRRFIAEQEGSGRVEWGGVRAHL